MQKLKSREKQIPGGGFDFRQPEINWHARKVLGLHPSLSRVANAVISARQSSPHYVQKHGWSLDLNTVLDEVEAFNVRRCQANGWMNFLTEVGGAPPPFNQAQSLANQKQLNAAVEKVKKLWAGVKTINDWMDSEEPPVEMALAEQRAATCVGCILNGQGDFTAWFTVPAAGAIKRQLERLAQRKISTTLDDKLNICTACLCPMRVKVHTPIKYIVPHLSAEVTAALGTASKFTLDGTGQRVPSDPLKCWVLAETNQ